LLVSVRLARHSAWSISTKQALTLDLLAQFTSFSRVMGTGEEETGVTPKRESDDSPRRRRSGSSQAAALLLLLFHVPINPILFLLFIPLFRHTEMHCP
jgi:hypothetical protein